MEQDDRAVREPVGERLVVEPRLSTWSFYDVLLDWLEEHHPGVRSRFELRLLPTRVRNWAPYRLHVPWLQDPVQAWSPRDYRRSNRLATACDAHGVPIVNRVDRLVNASKGSGAGLIASAGLLTARCVPIQDAGHLEAIRAELGLPLIVRENWHHGGAIVLLETDRQLRSLDLTRFRRPIALEFVDVQSDDGLYRKYRYVLAGALGVRKSMHVTEGWLVHGYNTVYSEAYRDEEIAYLAAPEPEHDRFQAARDALGLDFLAFDYSYTRDGRPIVWEANPYPLLHFIGGRRTYRDGATARVLGAVATLYLETAGLPVPTGLRDPSDLE